MSSESEDRVIDMAVIGVEELEETMTRSVFVRRFEQIIHGRSLPSRIH